MYISFDSFFDSMICSILKLMTFGSYYLVVFFSLIFYCYCRSIVPILFFVIAKYR